MRKVFNFMKPSASSDPPAKPNSIRFEWKTKTPTELDAPSPASPSDVEICDITDQMNTLQVSKDHTAIDVEPEEEPVYGGASEIKIERGSASELETEIEPGTEPLDVSGSSEPSSDTATRKMKPNDADDYEKIVRIEKYVKLARAYQRCRRFKKIPRKAAVPSYLKEPPVLMWVETDTNYLRKVYIKEKYKNFGISAPFKSKPVTAGDQDTVRTKLNRAFELRKAYTNNQPVSSSYFDRHYAKFEKPPFRRVNVKLN